MPTMFNGTAVVLDADELRARQIRADATWHAGRAPALQEEIERLYKARYPSGTRWTIVVRDADRDR